MEFINGGKSGDVANGIELSGMGFPRARGVWSACGYLSPLNHLRSPLGRTGTDVDVAWIVAMSSLERRILGALLARGRRREGGRGRNRVRVISCHSQG